jgi:uncharacterized protein (TIGR02231 family)
MVMLTPLLLAIALCGQEPAVPVRAAPTVLDRVTVYDGQALVERVVAAQADLAGPLTLLLGPFPESANPDSFQTIVTSGDVVVLGLELRTRAGDALAEGDREALVAALAEQRILLRGVETELTAVQSAKETISGFIQGLAAGGKEAMTTFAAEEAVRFVREQVHALETEQAGLERRSQAIRDTIKDLELQLSNGTRRGDRHYQELRLALHFQKPGEASVRVSYLVQGAAWEPTYDVRVAPDLTGVRVGFVAQLRQSTGEDWTDAEIMLSTSQPSIGLDPPEPPTRVVSAWAGRGMLESLGYSGDAAAPAARAEDKEFVPAPEVGYRDFGLSAQFVLPGRKSVPSNGEAHRFAIREVPLQVTPYRYVVPSLSDRAYLRADVTLASGAPLLAGAARIFLGPDYLGEAAFPLMKVGDGTTLNLGVDPNLAVTWETIQDDRENPGRFSLSSTARITRVYRASLRLSATARSTVDVVVEEALPMSRDGRVEVKVVQLQPAPLDAEVDLRDRDERGLYRWRLRIAPGATEAVRYGYQLSFDEDLDPIVGEE